MNAPRNDLLLVLALLYGLEVAISGPGDADAEAVSESPKSQITIEVPSGATNMVVQEEEDGTIRLRLPDEETEPETPARCTTEKEPRRIILAAA